MSDLFGGGGQSGAVSSNDALVQLEQQNAADAKQKEADRQARLNQGSAAIKAIFEGAPVMGTQTNTFDWSKFNSTVPSQWTIGPNNQIIANDVTAPDYGLPTGYSVISQVKKGTAATPGSLGTPIYGPASPSSSYPSNSAANTPAVGSHPSTSQTLPQSTAALPNASTIGQSPFPASPAPALPNASTIGQSRPSIPAPVGSPTTSMTLPPGFANAVFGPSGQPIASPSQPYMTSAGYAGPGSLYGATSNASGGGGMGNDNAQTQQAIIGYSGGTAGAAATPDSWTYAIQGPDGKIYNVGDPLTYQSSYDTGQTSGGFGDDFYNKYRQSVMDYYSPQEAQQYGDARSNLSYALARAGQLDSSVAGMDVGKLANQDLINQANIASNADTQTAALRNQVASAEQQALSQLYSTEDPSLAANTATNLAANAQLTKPLLNPASALFDPITVGVGNALSGFLNPTAYINPNAASSGTATTPSGSGSQGQTVFS